MSEELSETPLFDRGSSIRGYKLNKMAMALGTPENREAFKADEAGFATKFGVDEQTRKALAARDWHELFRLGGNLFYLLKIAALDGTPIVALGAAQAGMTIEQFKSERLGK